MFSSNSPQKDNNKTLFSFSTLKSLADLHPEPGQSNTMRYFPHKSEPNYYKYFEQSPFPTSTAFFQKETSSSTLTYNKFHNLGENEKLFIICYHQNCAYCHQNVIIEPTTIIVKEMVNLISYALHDSCYSSLILTDPTSLNVPSKITIIKGELNLNSSRKLLEPVVFEEYPVLIIKGDISTSPLLSIPIQSYQCFSGENTVLIEQTFDCLFFKSPFVRIRMGFKWLDANVENCLDLIESYSTNVGQTLTVIIRWINIHAYAQFTILKSNVNDRISFTISFTKISFEITKQKFALYSNIAQKIPSFQRYDQITHSTGSFSHEAEKITKVSSNPIQQKLIKYTPKHSKTPKGKASKKPKNENVDYNAHPIEFYKGKIAEIAKSQNGSKYLQSYLQDGTQEGIMFIASDIENGFASLLINKYGNYFCQKLIKCISFGARLMLLKKVNE